MCGLGDVWQLRARVPIDYPADGCDCDAEPVGRYTDGEFEIVALLHAAACPVTRVAVDELRRTRRR